MRTDAKTAAVVMFLFSAACSHRAATPGPSAASPAATREPPVLAYAVPSPNPLLYDVADTGRVSMSFSGTDVDVGFMASARIEMQFAAQETPPLHATVRFTSFSGSFTNSMAGDDQLSNADAPAPVQLEITPRGAFTIMGSPEVSTRLRQVLGGDLGMRRLFTRLPARSIANGTTWTDTLTTRDANAGLTTSLTEIVTSTLAGDSTVEGKRVAVIRSSIAGTTEIVGQTQGVELRQTLHSTATALTLWDWQKHAIVERTSSGTATGSMDMPAMGMSNLPVSGTTREWMRLRPN